MFLGAETLLEDKLLKSAEILGMSLPSSLPCGLSLSLL